MNNPASPRPRKPIADAVVVESGGNPLSLDKDVLGSLGIYLERAGGVLVEHETPEKRIRARDLPTLQMELMSEARVRLRAAERAQTEFDAAYAFGFAQALMWVTGVASLDELGEHARTARLEM